MKFLFLALGLGSGRGSLGCSLWVLQGLSPLGPLPLDSWVGGEKQPVPSCYFCCRATRSARLGHGGDLSAGLALLKLLAQAGCLFRGPGLGGTGTSLPGQVELSEQLQPLGESLWCVLGLPRGKLQGNRAWFLSEETQDKMFNSQVPRAWAQGLEPRHLQAAVRQDLRLSCLGCAGLGSPVKCPRVSVEHPISNC